MGGEWSLGVALVMECWPERHRPRLAGAIGAASNVGFALIGLITLSFKVTVDSWRWVMVVGAAPALLTFFIRLFVPESQRWKESVTGIVARPIREIFSPGMLKTTLLAIAFASIALIGTWGSVQWAPVWADKLTDGKVPEAKALTGLVSAIGAIVGCIVGPLVGGAIGRRPTYFLLCLLSLITCGYLFRAFDSYGPAFLLAVGAVGATTASFYGWLPLYLPELFPTRARATGQGLSFNFGRILAAGGALVQGGLVEHFGSYAKAGAIVTLVYALGLVLIWLAPETKGKPLPD
jgi:MFS family permease